jgi:hypothetical protein
MPYNLRISARKWLSICAALALCGCVATVPSQPGTKASRAVATPESCSDRIGRCFEVRVGGHWAAAIADVGEFESLRRLLESRGERPRDMFWSIDETLTAKSALDVIAEANANGKDFLGDLKDGEPDVTIVSLDDQWLDVIPEIVPSPNVFVNDSPMMVQQDTLAQNFLPPGRYALMIDYHGRKNWDRKWVFIKVK